MEAIFGFPLFLIILAGLYLWSSIRILSEYERGVIFRLGRMRPQCKGPGIILVFTFIDRMERISLRLVALDVPTQDVITRDNVTVKVNAVLYFRVVDPNRAIVAVEDFLYATSQLAQTTLRSVLGQSELDELLSARDKLNNLLQNILDQHTDPWGVKVTNVEIKHVDLPQEMQRAMAKQAEAERERRAKVINAEGEFQASTRLAEAANIIGQYPAAIQLRFLQSLTELASQNNSTVVVLPLPMDLMGPFKKNEKE